MGFQGLKRQKERVKFEVRGVSPRLLFLSVGNGY